MIRRICPKSEVTRFQLRYELTNSDASLPLVSPIRRSMVGVNGEPNRTKQ